jgi:rfaE bifunctional protein nucleotidyltransferase chain/domain
MTRAVILAGWGREEAGAAMREFVVLCVPGKLPRSMREWLRFAEKHEVELSASWLILRNGRRNTPGGGFLRGCCAGVESAGLSRVLARLDTAASRSRVISHRETVAQRSARLRSRGKRIVFTNGVFDLFHVGHLRLLLAARALGDALVVGVNSDSSTRRIKGNTRPLVSQYARAELVAGVKGVNFCALFDEDDPRALLRAVRPDVLAKGSEYTRAQVVGARLVEAWGGRVELIPHVGGWSTSSLLEKLKA